MFFRASLEMNLLNVSHIFFSIGLRSLKDAWETRMQTFSDIMDLAKRTAKGASKPRRKSEKILCRVHKTKSTTRQRQTLNERVNASKVLIEPNLFDNFLPNMTPKK